MVQGRRRKYNFMVYSRFGSTNAFSCYIIFCIDQGTWGDMNLYGPFAFWIHRCVLLLYHMLHGSRYLGRHELMSMVHSRFGSTDAFSCYIIFCIGQGTWGDMNLC
ncbi:hypothetical protein BT96DRAFT_672809 [Gymnopus androsaceus JB14]|uniref:Uncharacterized protein n=1 Tax=Gymnopus androsaceus JB14 TaxID=1447944 RepID=A0A6A4HRL5_9AGAR|nr:hypothetical protein BT96DRAFT_672809 [Gymnopus androsaceus JB14]